MFVNISFLDNNVLTHMILENPNSLSVQIYSFFVKLIETVTMGETNSNKQSDKDQ